MPSTPSIPSLLKPLLRLACLSGLILTSFFLLRPYVRDRKAYKHADAPHQKLEDLVQENQGLKAQEKNLRQQIETLQAQLNEQAQHTQAWPQDMHNPLDKEKASRQILATLAQQLKQANLTIDTLQKQLAHQKEIQSKDDKTITDLRNQLDQAHLKTLSLQATLQAQHTAHQKLIQALWVKIRKTKACLLGQDKTNPTT